MQLVCYRTTCFCCFRASRTRRNVTKSCFRKKSEGFKWDRLLVSALCSLYVDASLMRESVCWSVALVSTVRLDSVFGAM